MSEVTQHTQGTIDRLLDRAFAAWEGLPATAEEIDEWDLSDQLTYTEEWHLEEDRLRRLRVFAERGEMNSEQRHRFARLEEVVNEHRPVLEHIMRG